MKRLVTLEAILTLDLGRCYVNSVGVEAIDDEPPVGAVTQDKCYQPLPGGSSDVGVINTSNALSSCPLMSCGDFHG